MSKAAFWGLILSLILLAACQRGVVYTQVESIGEEGWAVKDFKKFELYVEDTLSSHSLELIIRHDSRYGYSNLFLFIQTTAPTGASIRDTIECPLADRSGKWFGRGIGGQYQLTVPYKYQVVFPFKGGYKIEVEQGMREDPLPYIRDIGLMVKIEK